MYAAYYGTEYVYFFQSNIVEVSMLLRIEQKYVNLMNVENFI